MCAFLVDIILPIFKPKEQVYKSFNSLIFQNHVNWHLFIIDDSSNEIVTLNND